ncbi:MAG TPA: 2-succinyl-6-hydroxy-2,4-cyclohexadiene-1-carboxylate synthase [Solirubrobacteraceae bacterium]|nr:2-succinyl-6-hydroxy-2,4-cyclohexadiene-1-carboxylate synthase [Solirubrobacteraceae bacterium]
MRDVTDDLMLLHGFTHTGASWSRVGAALGERYRPLAPDLPGHGRAGAVRPADLTRALAGLRPLLGDGVVLGGYSMGGRIALHLALAEPARIRRLVLVGASPGLADPQERARRRAADDALADEVQASTAEAFARRWARTPVLAGLPDDVAAEVHADRLRSTADGLAAALRGLGTGALPSLWDRLDELTMPVTLVAGGRDEKFRAIAGRMAAGLPAAKVIVVPGAGHAVHLEAPDAVAEVLAAG